MKQGNFEYNYTGVGFILDLQVEVELEYVVESFDEPGVKDFSFSVIYPEDLIVIPSEQKVIEAEISEHIRDNFHSLIDGSYYGYY